MKGEFKLDQYIMHHLQDGHEWSLPFLPPIKLPQYLSLHGLMLLICSGILILLFVFLYDKKNKIPNRLTNMLECFVLFIRDEIAHACLGKEDGRKLTPLLCTIFFFILTLNIMGLIPLFSTATANISVTASLAAIIFIVMVFGAIIKNGPVHFFQAFIPSGVPVPINLVVGLIEFLGIFIKPVALTIRLFANMFAGHIVIFSLIGLVVMFGAVASPMIGLALFIYLLEVLVAFLQAYIFTFLSALFIGQLYHPQH